MEKFKWLARNHHHHHHLPYDYSYPISSSSVRWNSIYFRRSKFCCSLLPLLRLKLECWQQDCPWICKAIFVQLELSMLNVAADVDATAAAALSSSSSSQKCQKLGSPYLLWRHSITVPLREPNQIKSNCVTHTHKHTSRIERRGEKPSSKRAGICKYF